MMIIEAPEMKWTCAGLDGINQSLVCEDASTLWLPDSPEPAGHFHCLIRSYRSLVRTRTMEVMVKVTFQDHTLHLHWEGEDAAEQEGSILLDGKEAELRYARGSYTIRNDEEVTLQAEPLRHLGFIVTPTLSIVKDGEPVANLTELPEKRCFELEPLGNSKELDQQTIAQALFLLIRHVLLVGIAAERSG